MNLQVKSGLIIVTTLLVGISIGTFIAAPHLARRHLARMDMLRHQPGFSRGIERLIIPDRSQLDDIKPIVKKYSERFETLFEKHRDEVEALMDSLRAELDPLLTDQQKARLDRMRSRRMIHRHKRW